MRNRVFSAILLGGIAVPYGAMAATPAHPEAKKANPIVVLTVCNRSAGKASVAVMARDITSAQMEMHGWAGVEPNQCANVASFLTGEFYVYAASDNGQRWEGASAECAPRASFSAAPKTQCDADEDSVKFLRLVASGADYTWTLNGPQNQTSTVATVSTPVLGPTAVAPAPIAPAPIAATPVQSDAPAIAPSPLSPMTMGAPLPAPSVPVQVTALNSAPLAGSKAQTSTSLAASAPTTQVAQAAPPPAAPQHLDTGYFNGKEIKFLVTPDAARDWNFYSLVAQYLQKYLPGAHVAATTSGEAADNVGALYKSAPDGLTLVMEPLSAMNDPAIGRAVPNFSTFDIDIIGFAGAEPDQAMAFGPPNIPANIGDPLRQAWTSAMADPAFRADEAALHGMPLPAPALPQQAAAAPQQQMPAPAPATAADDDSKPPLLLAVDRHDLAAVQQLLSSNTDPDSADADKLAALNWAAHDGDLDIVRALVEHGANVNIAANAQGWSPLMNAAANGHAETAQYLLAHGAHIELADAAGWTALGYAADNDRADVVTLLQAAGAKTMIDLDKARAYEKGVVGMIWDGKRDDFKSMMGSAASAPHAGLGGEVGSWYVNAPPFYPGGACEIDYTASGHFLRCQMFVPDRDTGARLMAILADATKEKVPPGWKIDADPSSFAAMNPANENEDASVALNYYDNHAMYAVDWSIGSPSSSEAVGH